MRFARRHEGFELRRVGAEGSVPARQAGLQRLHRTVKDDHPPRHFRQPTTLVVQQRAPAKRHDLRLHGVCPPAVGVCPPVANAPKAFLFNRTEALFAFFCKDLRNTPSRLLHNLGVKVNEPPSRCRGDLLRQRRLAGSGRTVEEEV